MIVTNVEHIARYLGTNQFLDIALRYLMNYDLSLLHKGRNEVHGEDVFINRFCYETVCEKDSFWEGHLAYGDIHVILEGNEKIGINNPANLTEISRNTEDDFIGFNGPVQTWVPMAQGDVLIVFPEDVHMTKVSDNKSCHVEKAVIKFRI